jgi:Ger(x)C family germination protein
MKPNPDQRRLITSITVTLLMLGLFLLPGCFDNEDIDRRMIISAIGIDAEPGRKMLVTFRMPVILPMGQGQGGGTKQGSYVTRSSSAPGVLPALIDIQNRDEHNLFIGQCRALVIGETMAKRGLTPALDFFDRMPSFPSSALVMIARPSAADILKINWPEQETHDQNFRWFFANQSNQIYGIKEWKLFQSIGDPLQDPLVPIVTPSDGDTTMKLTGLAVFRQDRMIGELTSEESALWAMLRNLKKENRLPVPVAGATAVTFQIVTGKKKLAVAYSDHPLFTLELKLKAFLGEIGGYSPILDQRKLNQLEADSARYLERQYLALFGKLQAMKSDPLELGNTFRIQQPGHFSPAKWPREYQRAQFRVRVKVFIERLGVLK